MEYLIRFSQSHETFRLAEIQALATLNDIKLEIVSYKSDSPFCIVRLADDDAAARLVRRSLLAQSIHSFWGHGATLDEFHADVRRRAAPLWPPYADASFKLEIDSFQGKRTAAARLALIDMLPLRGEIDLRDPAFVLTVCEQWRWPLPEAATAPDRDPLHYYLGRGGRAAAPRWIDGIVCDPPYGVREGLRVLGVRNPAKTPWVEEIGRRMFKDPAFVPPKQPYSFLALLDDLLRFAADTLVDGGRLGFWMPTANDEALELPVPTHPCLAVVSVCTQAFRSRRLITYQRIPDVEVDAEALRVARAAAASAAVTPKRTGQTVDDLNPFRRSYFRKFELPPEQVPPGGPPDVVVAAPGRAVEAGEATAVEAVNAAPAEQLRQDAEGSNEVIQPKATDAPLTEPSTQGPCPELPAPASVPATTPKATSDETQRSMYKPASDPTAVSTETAPASTSSSCPG
ncbi:hypothetical protein SPI_02297 [Niveomyces insectorum RCEF 264]|uniref:tRNA (guanine(10)-N(2))-methyltransferase TRMT11 N-terminal domain-containing protein n=1 Tax=Niveomyces insectorum RCEF 264 TaxID=1081102 RepID=A0A162MR29_9HYPO|nr:hypothetical protein SPI_02297 [Niveomyces insectorum RCEF 264]